MQLRGVGNFQHKHSLILGPSGIGKSWCIEKMTDLLGKELVRLEIPKKGDDITKMLGALEKSAFGKPRIGYLQVETIPVDRVAEFIELLPVIETPIVLEANALKYGAWELKKVTEVYHVNLTREKLIKFVVNNDLKIRDKSVLDTCSIAAVLNQQRVPESNPQSSVNDIRQVSTDIINGRAVDQESIASTHSLPSLMKTVNNMAVTAAAMQECDALDQMADSLGVLSAVDTLGVFNNTLQSDIQMKAVCMSHSKATYRQRINKFDYKTISDAKNVPISFNTFGSVL